MLPRRARSAEYHSGARVKRLYRFKEIYYNQFIMLSSSCYFYLLSPYKNRV